MEPQAVSCQFPATGRPSGGLKRPLSVRLELQHPEHLQELFAQGAESLSAAVVAAWALTLRCYTGLDEVCFGFEEVGVFLNSRVAEGHEDGITPSHVAILRIDPSVPFTTLVDQALDEENIVSESRSNNAQFNTAVMVRNGSAAPQSPNKPAVLSDKVLVFVPHPFFVLLS
jgi:hypothetical protein